MVDVVLVDDDELVRTTVKQILEKDGHQVRVAPNGDKALQLVADRQPALVITDVIMPEREGIETLLALKKKSPDLKIIVMSGGGRIGQVDYLKVASDLGADATLTKPFTAAQLRELLANLLGSGSSLPTCKEQR